MPKLPHEALVQLVRNAPAQILELLRPEVGGAAARPVHVTAAEFADLNFAEHRADAVLTVGGAGDRPDEAFVVEVQSDEDGRKRLVWPLYVAGVRTRLACPVTLVVIALDPAVARWCAAPIDLGRGRCLLHPWVLGSGQIPCITDPEQARRAPELAVLSVAAHADEDGAEAIALAALDAVATLDSDRSLLYPDFILALLGKAARTALEKLMFTHPRVPYSDILREQYFKGEAVGKAKFLLKLLKLRGFTVPEPVEQRVLDCRDDAQLDAWAERVLDARSLTDVLDA